MGNLFIFAGEKQNRVSNQPTRIIAMQQLPIGIQSFEGLRTDDFAYVDKTKLIYDLIHNGKYIFLSRPRRFGKSLLLSTLKAYFQGKKELFEGLAVSELEQEWESNPILYLDLNVGMYTSKEGLEEALNSNLVDWEEQYDTKLNSNDAAQRFKYIIKTLAQSSGKKVVILVDEYDKPLIEAINDEPLQQEFRNMLKAFYGNLKTCDEYIRFAMLTGVSKFSKISLFSDLNNLQDISLDERYADICGLTAEEIEHTLSDHLEAFAQKEGTTKADIMEQMRKMYDGYHFSENTSKDIYNPFSVLNALSERTFRNYWFSTGTPSFLIKLLQNGEYDLQDFSNGDLLASDLAAKESLRQEPIALFYQTGYLTIKRYEKEFGSYRLGFPNREVEQSFLKFLLPRFTGNTDNGASAFIEYFVRDLRKGDIESFLGRMRSFFANTPYELVRDLENHYQTVMFTICRLLGYYTKAEYHTSNGRIDMVVKANQFTYVFEFKFNKTAQEALAQIDTKEYALPFQAEGQKVFKVGINFSKETRNIDDFIWKEA